MTELVFNINYFSGQLFPKKIVNMQNLILFVNKRNNDNNNNNNGYLQNFIPIQQASQKLLFA